MLMYIVNKQTRHMMVFRAFLVRRQVVSYYHSVHLQEQKIFILSLKKWFYSEIIHK